MGTFNRARTLVKSRRYPTFQFCGTAASHRIPADKQMVVCALTTLEWMRRKFSRFDLPRALCAPAAERYEEVSVEDLKSVRINEGYTVDIISLPRQRIWSLRLTEPDLSMELVDGQERSTAVPGRIFQTEVAFRVINGVLHCGFRVIISEPETVTAPCKVFRPAIVQALAEHPLVGFQCGYPISGQTLLLNKPERVKQLREYLAGGNIPAVLLCDLAAAAPAVPFAVQNMGTADLFRGQPIPGQLAGLFPAAPVTIRVSGEKPAEEPYKTEELLQKRACYAHFFRCGRGVFESLERVFRVKPHSGDILLLEPARFGGGVKVFPLEETPEKNLERVARYLRDHPRDLFDYGGLVFHAEADVLQIEELRSGMTRHADVMEAQSREITALKSQVREMYQQANTSARNYADKVQKLQQDTEERVRQVRETAERQVRKAERERDGYRIRLEYLESLPQRPKTPGEVPAWVEKRFDGRMTFHQKAVRLISGTAPDEVNLPLLCDALEYLATEYRDVRTGKLSGDEANDLCAVKYGRTFAVTPVGSETIRYATADYKIKYRLGAAGKEVETVLDLHLKVGNSPGNLLRIYFLYDDVRNLVVVGSLPKHLKIKSYS